MHISGERRIPAPRERVWRSLADPKVIEECLAGSLVTPDGLSGTFTPAANRPVPLRTSVREPFSTMGWKIDPDGPASQMVLLRLAEEGVFTRLHYELSLADRPGAETASDEAAIRRRIDAALTRLIGGVAGPAEIGAGGLAGAVQAVTDPSSQPNARIGAAPQAGLFSGIHFASLMNPTVIGGVLFLVVLLFVVGLF